MCVCPPGTTGLRCEQRELGSCRVSTSRDIMACQGFGGLMSCKCMEECINTIERYSVGGRFLSVKDKICFEVNGRAPETSNGPTNLSHARFFARARLNVSRWEIDSSIASTREGWIADPDSRPRWAKVANYVRVKALRPRGWTPLSNGHCPEACNHAGTCVDNNDGHGPSCQCHKGFTGSTCEPDPVHCFNGCSGHGQCEARFCNCEAGWFGVDCSLSLHAPRQTALQFAPTYVYSLPTEVSLQFTYQRDPTKRGTFYTNRVFLEMLHARQDSLVADPEKAALFFVPIMLNQMKDNVWEARRFLTSVVDWLRIQRPFWNRTNGADHIFFTGQDLGGCWMPETIRGSIIISHFGFIGPTQLWIDVPRWHYARHVRHGWMAGYNWSLPKCYVPRKDVVVPVDFHIRPSEHTRHVATLESECTLPFRRKASATPTLLYMAGAVNPPNRGSNHFYSQGVRQEFYRLHRSTSGVRYDVGSWDAVNMRSSLFCLAPSGWGYGWRTYLAVAMRCIPVIVQPLVKQAFHDLLPYSTFSLRFDIADILHIPQLLRLIARNQTHVCQLRRAAAHYYRALLWEPPGLAYEMLQVSLCQRALLRFLEAQPSGQRTLPDWHACAQISAEQLLRRPPRTERAWGQIEASPAWM
jgi:hypothetical protein